MLLRQQALSSRPVGLRQTAKPRRRAATAAAVTTGGRAAVASPPPPEEQEHQFLTPPQSELSTTAVGFQPEEQQHEALANSSSSTQQACPFLASLPSPPPAQHAWWNRLQQLTAPEKFQRAALGDNAVATIPAQLGLAKFAIVSTADMAKSVLAGEGQTTLQGWEDMVGFSALMGTKSLLLVQEPRHKMLRGLVMPAFSNEAIELLTVRMEAVIGGYLARWAASPEPVLAVDAMQRMTFDFIVAVILGHDYDETELEELRVLYRAWASGLLAWPFIDLPFTPYGRALAARRKLVARLQQEIDGGRQALAQGRPVAGILGSFLTASDEEGNMLTDEELQDNLLLLLLAGHDTTSSTLVNVMAKLQEHPEVLQKLRDEQEQVVARLGPAIDGSLLREMPYADAVIKETLRVAGIVGALTRKAATDLDMGGYKVAAGTNILLPLVLLAKRDPRWADDTDDVETFRPERQLGADTAANKASWAMPFGYGPRFCAGYAVAMAEMRVFLALLARHYDFVADINTTWVSRIGPTPKNGLPMSVTRRP